MDNPLEIRSALGRYAIAIAMVAFGVQHLVYGDFVTRMVPRLPAWIPGHAALAYGFGAFLIVAGGALMQGPTAHLAALVLGGTLLASFSLLYLPMALSDLRNAGLWTNAGKALALSGGAFLVAGDSLQKSGDPCRWPAKLSIPLERLIPFGRYFSRLVPRVLWHSALHLRAVRRGTGSSLDSGTCLLDLLFGHRFGRRRSWHGPATNGSVGGRAFVVDGFFCGLCSSIYRGHRRPIFGTPTRRPPSLRRLLSPALHYSSLPATGRQPSIEAANGSGPPALPSSRQTIRRPLKSANPRSGSTEQL